MQKKKHIKSKLDKLQSEFSCVLVAITSWDFSTFSFSTVQNTARISKTQAENAPLQGLPIHSR